MYGPDGDWAKLFRSDTSYRETRLVRDVTRPAVYLTMDFWVSRKAYEQFMESHVDEYKALDAIGEELTLKETRVGSFESIKK